MTGRRQLPRRVVAPALLLLALRAAGARAEPVPVVVLEVAGDVVYVSPGRAAGLAPGTKVTVKGHALVVVAVTEKTAALRDDRRALSAGDTGTCEVNREAAAAAPRLARPKPASEFVGQWREPVLPATTQTPRDVSLGAGGAGGRGRSHLTVIARGDGAGDLDRQAGAGELRAIASFEVLTERPLALDVDVAGRVFSAGYDSGARAPVAVRAAQLRYGSATDPQLALGRLRYASSSLGALDGGRASFQRGDLGVSAFGGIVPDLPSGKPDPRAARFGAEVSYDAPTAPWQPRVALAASGSTWRGALDERRLTAVASASRGRAWLDAWAEAQAFSSDNAWGAGALELTFASVSGQWRDRERHLAVDVSYQRPERSQRLAEELPLEWLCTPELTLGDTAQTCRGGDSRASATLSAGVRRTRWAVDAVGALTRTHGLARSLDRSAFLRGEVQLGAGRVEAGAAAGKTSFASWNSAELGAAYAPARDLDVGVRYRPELLDYVASTGPVLRHSLVADGRYAVAPALALTGSAVATTGANRDALGLSLTLVWRPLP
ncbi:MAG: hypothetical protein R3B48_18105 [Kofleriaceae bacterium]